MLAALNNLLHEMRLSVRKNEDEERFFASIARELNEFCKELAAGVNAESAAIFFVTQEPWPGAPPHMVMRGASGRLFETFKTKSDLWNTWIEEKKREPKHKPKNKDKEKEKEAPDLGGFAYPSRLTREFCERKQAEQQQEIRAWSVTNQIWHLAEGRIANSNQAMDRLHGVSHRTGLGDPDAYPGDNLGTTFRTLVAVPAFAEGMPYSEEERKTRISLAQLHSKLTPAREEFLSRYEVVGILKLEGKLADPGGSPSFDACAETICSDNGLHMQASEEPTPPRMPEGEIREWWREAKDLTPARILTKRFPAFLRGSKKAHQLVRKAFADAFTRHFHAEFTRDDMELLVLLAMQVGRILTRRVILHAAHEKIILSENEVALLGIQWRDVDQLRDLREAAYAAMCKVQNDLIAVGKEIDAERHKEVYRARVSRYIDVRGPIRIIEARCKECHSLISKLARKQRALQEHPFSSEIKAEVTILAEERNPALDQRRIGRGGASVFRDRPTVGATSIDILARMDTEDGTSMFIQGTRLPVAVQSRPKLMDPSAPLIRRILAKEMFAVDDLAGVRVIADYNRDIDLVLEEFRARTDGWNTKIDKIDDWRRGREGGYRAVHLIVQVDVAPLVEQRIVDSLREGLDKRKEEPLLLPVEIQLRTAYQHSWALKTHGVSYKRERDIPEGLLDEQEILSNVLAEADRLSDIVRGDITVALLPNDYGERRLIEFLSRRAPRDDLVIVQLGLACAKEVLKDTLRYNGEPEYSFALEVCQWLVYAFGQTNPYMLLVGLLQSVWQTRQPEHGTAVALDDPANPTPADGQEDIPTELQRRLEESCGGILQRFCGRLVPYREERAKDDWFATWLRQAPWWFWSVQRGFRAYYTRPIESQLESWKRRLRDVHKELRARGTEGCDKLLDVWLEHALAIEAAILLATLTELPMAPGGKARRAQLHREYLAIFREIRKKLPNGSVKPTIVAEIDRALRELETREDLSREPEWWGE